MLWNLCFALSAAALLAALAAAARPRGGSRRPFQTLFAGVFAAVFLGLLPILAPQLAGERAFALKLVLYDALQTIRVFILGIGAEVIFDALPVETTAVSGVYSAYMTVLFFLAPLLTFGFIISLFRSALSSLRYLLRWNRDAYVFSELNDRSLTLAADLRAHHPKALLVFAGVNRDDERLLAETAEAAGALRAILLTRDMLSFDFARHSPEARITFLAIGEDESENVSLALRLLERYREREHTDLFVFSAGAEGELLLSGAQWGQIRLRRVDDVRSLVYRYLYTDGAELFDSAVPSAEGTREIRAAIVGLDGCGTELLRALAWFCQMDGYTVTLDAFDPDERAADRFAALCPELMSERNHGACVPEESSVAIRVHAGAVPGTKSFADAFAALGGATFVFVSLGSDERNISAAADLRMLSERAGAHPVIRAVVRRPEAAEALASATNYRGQSYAISPLGDLRQQYSEQVLLGTELERLALQRHLKWGEEREFWQYAYNYRSSMASAVHMHARAHCGVAGAGKAEDTLTQAERDALERLEHRRWNAYMRSEGYVYSGSPEKSSRNDLGKMHHDLVVFDALSEAEKRKDSSVGSL